VRDEETARVRNLAVLDQLLLRRFAGKVRRGAGVELVRHHDSSNRSESLFAPVLTVYSQASDNDTERKDNGRRFLMKNKPAARHT